MLSLVDARMDLHCHSTASDGLLRPRRIVAKAAVSGRTLLSITDHDTLGGLEEAHEEAVKRGIRLVPGVEVSTIAFGRTCHLLVWFNDMEVWSPAFEAMLAERREVRERRLDKMLVLLDGLGVGISRESVEAETRGGAVTRAHVARALLSAGRIKKLQEAFDLYIGDRGPAHVPYEELRVEDAIAVAQAEGGVTSIAHPADQRFGREELGQLAAVGLDGIEIVHPGAGRSTRKRLRKIARELGLLQTGGSDWHGTGRHGILDGDTAWRSIDVSLRRPFEEALERAADRARGNI